MPSLADPEAAPPAETRRDRLLRRDSAATQAVARLPHPRWLTAPYGALSLSANYGLLWFAIAAVPWLAGASSRRPHLRLRRRVGAGHRVDHLRPSS